MSYMEIRNLKKVYNPYGMHPKVALNGLDFKVEKGDFICIMGASGSGKQHLLTFYRQLMKQQKDKFSLIKKIYFYYRKKRKQN